jgi:MerR family transcriptional regulator, repressor of the yfmOP operon
MPRNDHTHHAPPLADGQPDTELAPGSLLIGQVSERTGLTQRTLRYYEELGLIPPAPRLEGGFRLYSEADVARIRHIIELKRVLGFSLLEIKDMVEAEEERREQRHAFHREVDPEARRSRAARALEIARFQLTKLDEHRRALDDLRTKTEARIRRYEAELRAYESEAGDR